MKARIISFLILIGGLAAIINLSHSTYSLLKKGDLFVQKEKRLAELKRKNEELKEILKKVQSQEFIEKEAREKLSMGKEGEVVVILPKIKNQKAPQERSSLREAKFKIEEELPNWRKWYKLFFY